MTLANPCYNSYEHLYRSGFSVRRWPEEDVVVFAAGLQNPRISADLGTGTGRNLMPLLLAANQGGLVVASDIAVSGLDVVREWAQLLGGETGLNGIY